MAYTKYSLTPANNTATPPDGAPEGMLPSAVNDTMRDMMAQIRDVGDGIRDGTYTMTAAKITGGTITGVTFTGNTFSNPTVTGVSTFAAGTVSAPAITTSGDTNTGIFFPAADTIAFTEGGVESMRIDSSGNFGIGTSSIGARLDIVGTTGTMRITSSTGTNGVNLRVNNTGGDFYFGRENSTGGAFGVTAYSSLLWSEGAYPMVFATNNAERMRITSGGEVYIAGTADQGAYNLQCNGTGVWGAGAYVNGSDARIKENIAPINSGLDVVAKLNPVTYRYKQDWSKDQSTQTGFIAQELLTALDGQVYVDGVVQQGGEYMSVAYQNIIPILTKSIQELHEIVKAQAAEIALLKSK